MTPTETLISAIPPRQGLTSETMDDGVVSVGDVRVCLRLLWLDDTLASVIASTLPAE